MNISLKFIDETLANATIVKDWEKSLLRGMGFK